MNIVNKYTLAQIGTCDLKSENSLLTIPNLQRGAVWRPRQVELLWDSILQGLPIGTLTVLSNEKRENNAYSGQLIDGQQRVNAIIAGFREPSQEDEIVVWIDADTYEYSDRVFAVRVTSRAHPWGYRMTGETFSAKERNQSIHDAGYTPGDPRNNWNILDFGPADSCLPIPFSYLLYAQGKDRQEEVVKKCEILAKTAKGWSDKFLEKVKAMAPGLLDRYFDAIDCLLGRKGNDEKYEVPAIIIDNTKNLELLFERIGKQGTPLTDKELAYALMKHYWGKEEFSDINAMLCYDLMPEEDFAVGVFRLFASTHGMRADIGSTFIHNIKNALDSESERIRNEVLYAYENNGELLQKLKNRVVNWILTLNDGSKYHPIILTEIVTTKPYLFVFLMRLAYIDIVEKRLLVSDGYIQALAFYLHTCLWNETKAIVKVYETVVQANSVTEKIIGDALRLCISYEWAMPIVDSFEDFPGLQGAAFDKEWKLDAYTQRREYYIFERLFQYGTHASDFMLKLAERKFFNRQYKDYNPSRKDLWIDQSRPWDHDHIVPQNWAGEDAVWSNFCLKWINCVGNIADIPFEINRGKGASDDWSVYERFPDELLYYPDNGVLAIDRNLATKESQAKILFDFVRKRFCLIADPFLKILQRLHLYDNLNYTQNLRKEVLAMLHHKHPDCHLYYYYRGLDIEFKEDDIFAWQQPWVSLSKGYGDDERVIAIVIAINLDNSFIVEWGLRKRPDLYIENLKHHTWYAPGNVIKGKFWPEWNDGEIILKNRYGYDAINDFESLLKNPMFLNSQTY